MRVGNGERESAECVGADGGSEARDVAADQRDAAVGCGGDSVYWSVVREAAREYSEVNVQRRAISAVEMQRGHPVQIVFEVGVFIAVGIGVAVGEIICGRIWIQSLDRFPPIGQAIMVAIPIRGTHGVAVIFPTAHVIL